MGRVAEMKSGTTGRMTALALALGLMAGCASTNVTDRSKSYEG